MKYKYLYIAMTSQLLASTVSMAGTKVIVKNNEKLPQAETIKLIEDYGSFKLYEMDQAEAMNVSRNNQNISVADEMNQLLFDSFRFDTQASAIKSRLNETSSLNEGEGLQMVQFVGPIKQNWLDAIEATGGQLVHYIANNGYLVWVNDNSREQINQLASRQSILQFSAPYTESFKLGNSIEQRFSQNTSPDEIIDVTIQIVDSPLKDYSKQIIEDLAEKVNTPWSAVMKFHSIRVSIKLSDINAVALLPDSYWVNEYFEKTLEDEVQNQILVGDLTPDNSGPAMTGYASFLSSKGFPTTPNSYPVVDITDDGIGNGLTTSGDPTFHEGGDVSNPTRLSYVSNCTAASNGESIGGHGHINTSIVGGFESRVGFPYIDPNGYIRTQGVNPFARIAGTRIFGPGFDLSSCGGTDSGLIKSVEDDGADIMSNSWGCGGCAGSYDDSSQAFDLGVRDADTSEAGNQELIMVFAAGNDGTGAGTIGTPGNGKNMITVGASENYRPTDEDGNWTDGCAVGPSGADNAMDVIGFSSRGPSPGGRTKPEVIAPGTHIQGTASTSENYSGSSVCDQYRPGSQTVVAASSGTSHSTPAVAGVSSLAYYWIENPPGSMIGDFSTPSPAMMKAYLVAHPTYLTGVSANDDLPSNSQGYGMPNMELMFDDTAKYLNDQNIVFDNTGQTWQWVGAPADPAKPVRIVMTYTDQPGAVGTSPQVNNIDLSVETNGSTYLGNVFTNEFSTTGGSADTLNNYEAVFFPAGVATDLSITVSASNIAGDGVPNFGDGTDQDFALVCYNCAQEPTFTLGATERTLEVCSPDDATYNLQINSILGFTDQVTLSSSGLPASATGSFSNTPVTPPGVSDFTVGNLVAVTAGNYQMTVTGISGPINKSLDLNLNLFDSVPNSTDLISPSDNASNVSGTNISFDWDDAAGASEYLFELADSADFSNIIESGTVSGSNYVSSLSLNPNAQYFWRVKSSNICGDTTPVEVFSFTTANEICVTPNLAIPDSNPLGSEATLDLIDANFVISVRAKVEVTHTYVGDLIATLTHEDSATTVVLMDRPGFPDSTFGCSANDMDVLFDSTNGTEPVENSCTPASVPGIGGILIPEQSLTTFSGVVASGAWTLNVSDNAGGDTGSITKFCLIPSTGPDLIFENGFEELP